MLARNEKFRGRLGRLFLGGLVMLTLTACPGDPQEIQVVQKVESFLSEPAEMSCKPLDGSSPYTSFEIPPGEVTVLKFEPTTGYTGKYSIAAVACESDERNYEICAAGLEDVMTNQMTDTQPDAMEVGLQLHPLASRCPEGFRILDPFRRLAGTWQSACLVQVKDKEWVQSQLVVNGQEYKLTRNLFLDVTCTSEAVSFEVSGKLVRGESTSFPKGALLTASTKLTLTPKREDIVGRIATDAYCAGTLPLALNIATELDKESCKGRATSLFAPLYTSASITADGKLTWAHQGYEKQGLAYEFTRKS